MLNRSKFESELRALGISLKGLMPDGDQEGRAVLSDGTIIPAPSETDQTISHDDGGTPDTAAAATYRSALAAHDPSDTTDQVAARRARLVMEALAVVMADGANAPTWAKQVVGKLAAVARTA